jgi:hypothetical protein
VLLGELAKAVTEGTRKKFMESVATVPLLFVDDFGMRKLLATAAADLLEIAMRRYGRASTLLTSNCPVRGLGKTTGRRGGNCPTSHSVIPPEDSAGGGSVSHRGGDCPPLRRGQNQEKPSHERKNKTNPRPPVGWERARCVYKRI